MWPVALAKVCVVALVGYRCTKRWALTLLGSVYSAFLWVFTKEPRRVSDALLISSCVCNPQGHVCCLALGKRSGLKNTQLTSSPPSTSYRRMCPGPALPPAQPPTWCRWILCSHPSERSSLAQTRQARAVRMLASPCSWRCAARMARTCWAACSGCVPSRVPVWVGDRLAAAHAASVLRIRPRGSGRIQQHAQKYAAQARLTPMCTRPSAHRWCCCPQRIPWRRPRAAASSAMLPPACASPWTLACTCHSRCPARTRRRWRPSPSSQATG